MPSRILRDGILTSDAVDMLTPKAEVFYRRLMSVVDDYGCFDGRASILLAALFPLKVGKYAHVEIQDWLDECDAAQLVFRYEIAGKPYVEVLNFNQRAQSHRRWPEPPKHKATVVHREPLLKSESESDAKAYSDSGANSNPPCPPKGGESEEIGFARFWADYPKKLNRLRAEAAWKHLTDEEKADAIAAIPRACKSAEWQRDAGQFIPQASKWLHGKCWLDDPKADYTPAKPKPVEPPKSPPPPWLEPLQRVLAIRGNNPNPDGLATFERLRIAQVLATLPQEGWSFLSAQEYNYFKPIFREHMAQKEERTSTIAETEPEPTPKPSKMKQTARNPRSPL